LARSHVHTRRVVATTVVEPVHLIPSAVAVRKAPRAPIAKPRAARHEAAVVETPRSSRDDQSQDWFLKSLMILLGLGGAVLALVVASEVGDVRTRVGSKGLSASRISLRGRARPADRDRTIAYRD
jgi:hypothetical protein